MQLDVRLFAALREALGCGQVSLPLPQGASVAALKAAIAEHYPVLAGHLPSVRVAASQRFVSDDYRIEAPEELALIPPVSGG